MPKIPGKAPAIPANDMTDRLRQEIFCLEQTTNRLLERQEGLEDRLDTLDATIEGLDMTMQQANDKFDRLIELLEQKQL